MSNTSPLIDYFDALADRLSSEPPTPAFTISSVRVLKPRESKPAASSRTGTFGQAIDGLAAIAVEAGLTPMEAEARLARLDGMGLAEQPSLGYWRAGPALELRCRRCLALPARPANSSCEPCGKVMQEEATGRRAEARKDGAPCLGCGQPKDGRKALFCANCRQRMESAERARRKAQTAGRRMRRLALRMLARQLRVRRFSLAKVSS